MKPIVLIHGYSAESPASDPTSIASIYGTLPQRLRASYDVVEVDLSRYVSLSDSVSVADIARADLILRDGAGNNAHLVAAMGATIGDAIGREQVALLRLRA